MCHWCSYHILTSSVIYYWTDAWQHGIYLCYIIKKQKLLQLFYFKIFLNYSKAGPCPLWWTRKKPFDIICCLYKMKQSHCLLCVARNCDSSRKITPLSNLTQMASLGVRTYSESRIELQNLQILKKMLEKSSQVLSSKQPCKPKRIWKNMLGKLVVVVNTRGHLIWVLNEKSVNKGVPCGWWFSNQFDIITDTCYSCNTVGCELQWAILCLLLCPETDWNICIGKQGYVFILTDFKKCWFDVSFLTLINLSQQCNLMKMVNVQ